MNSILSNPATAAHPFDWTECLRPKPPVAEAVAALARNAEVVVYGAGGAAEGLITLLLARGVKIRGVMDSKSKRTEISGYPVLRPNTPVFSTQDREDLPIALGIFNAFVDVSALRQDLENQGWRNIINFEELHATLPAAFGDRYWLTDRNFSRSHMPAIMEVDRLWADDLSRTLYRRLLRFRASGDRSGLPEPDRARQYFAADIPAWKTPLRFVDCGACDGDTVRQIQQLGLPIEALAAFEPDLANFAPLVKTLSELDGDSVPALAWPCGVGAETRIVRFRADRGAASALDSTGETAVPCVALDEVLSGFRPNFIKMDIEGAEKDALTGARRIIEKHRPGLAICVYHKPVDLWELPSLVASWQLDYRFYLRAHQYNDFDVVLYATPQSP